MISPTVETLAALVVSTASFVFGNTLPQTVIQMMYENTVDPEGKYLASAVLSCLPKESNVSCHTIVFSLYPIKFDTLDSPAETFAYTLLHSLDSDLDGI